MENTFEPERLAAFLEPRLVWRAGSAAGAGAGAGAGSGSGAGASSLVDFFFFFFSLSAWRTKIELSVPKLSDLKFRWVVWWRLCTLLLND